MVNMANGENIKRVLSSDEGAVTKSFGRGMFLGDLTPAKSVGIVGHPALSSTRMYHGVITPKHKPDPATNSAGIVRGASAACPRTASSTDRHASTFSPIQHRSDEGIGSPDIGELITQLAHQIGESIANQMQRPQTVTVTKVFPRLVQMQERVILG